MRRVFLGYPCNNTCRFCAQGDLGLVPAEFTPQAAREAIKEALAGASPERALAFIGGEPTLHEALPDWVAMAKSLGATWVLVQTNGRRLAKPNYCRDLAKAGADAVEVALQGSTAPMHDYHTRVAGSWRETCAGIAQAARAKLKVGVGTVVTRSNYRHLRALCELAHGLGASAVHFAPARPFGRAGQVRDSIVPAPELVAPYLLDALRRAKELGLPVMREARAAKTVSRLFAGLGAVQEAAPAPSRTAPVPEAASAGRPAPGLAEKRAKEKRTAGDLRKLFPDIYPGEAKKGSEA